MATRKKVQLTEKERLLLRAETLCDERTIDKWLAGEEVRATTRERLEAAAKKLGLAVGAT
jgi:hypothetical protein